MTEASQRRLRPAASLAEAAHALRARTRAMRFSAPITHVYNPLDYAWDVHQSYLDRYGEGKKKVVFLGMNPGPWGMAQVGVPFGEVGLSRDWLGLQGPVGRPDPEHPKRPILGFDCARSEVSGKRFWGLMAETFVTPERFFRDHFVANYCPLVFMEESGRNFTPDKLARSEREPLIAACDDHLRGVIAVLRPEWVIGVGAFAMKRAESALKGSRIRIGTILHPSPASPAANRDWPATVRVQLHALGIWT